MKHYRGPELEPVRKAEERRSKQPTQGRIVAVVANPDLIAVIIFGLIGGLISLNVMLRFPNLGLTVEQYSPFVGP